MRNTSSLALILAVAACQPTTRGRPAPAAPAPAEPPAGHDDVQVALVVDQADAALAILEVRAAGRTPTEQQWRTLWESQGYRRLLERETAMGRAEGFGDDLRAWLEAEATARRAPEFRRAVQAWRSFDARQSGRRAHAYLPDGFALRATLYPVIKHTQNTFVFDIAGDPAIFMTVDPAQPLATSSAIMTHELHHVGLGQCPAVPDFDRLDARQRRIVRWLGIFGEGLAMLATAGGPMQHPHFYSDATEYLVWERDIANTSRDLPRVEAFARSILDGSLPQERERQELMTFIATQHVPQGPAYTLGWKMAAMVERRFGRDALIAAMCDPRELLRLYNRAAAEVRAGDTALPLWSEDLLARLRASSD